MTDIARPDCEALLAHAGWVRALARHLTADAHAADDLAQETLAAALAGRPSPPSNARPLREWLGGVLRNLARAEQRGSANRNAREHAAARGEADPSSEDLLERLDSHRAVVEAVARLDEPYRTAILLRYFEDRSPAAIARATGAPLRTVHTRLHRALAQLRVDLDRRHGGDGHTWLLALIPFARGPRGLGTGGWTGAAIGAVVMDAKLKLALGALVVVGLCSTLALWSDDPTEVTAPALASETTRTVERAEPPRTPTLDPSQRVEERAPVEVPAASAPASEPALERTLTGRVIDIEGTAVAGVEVRFDAARGASDAVARTDAAGAFELRGLAGGGRLDVASPGWCVVYQPWVSDERPAPEQEIVLVVARGVALAGTVVDEQGRGIAGAELAVPLDFGFRARFDAILDEASTVEPSTTTDDDGRFVLERVPLVPGAKLVTAHPGHVADERALPSFDESALVIVLRPIAGAPAHLTGQVVDAQGLPVEDAWVGDSSATTRSGPGGTFALELAANGEPPALVRAVKRGHLPAEVARPAEGWRAPVVLRLGGSPLSIAGRVVDADGVPVAEAELWTTGETFFGSIPIEGGEMELRVGTNVEALLRDDAFEWRTPADSAGRFELEGLLPREYRVIALDRRRLLVTSVELRAGMEGVEIRLPREELLERIAGRVTSLSGEPLAGVQVSLERRLEGLDDRSPASRLASLAARTDDEGRFEFSNVTRAAPTVVVEGRELGLGGFSHVIEPTDDLEHLELAVPVTVHVQIIADDPAAFDRAVLLGPEGEELTLSVNHGMSGYGMGEMPLHEGRSEPFSVSEVAETLVLRRNGVEVRRMPLHLASGSLNTIRP